MSGRAAGLCALLVLAGCGGEGVRGVGLAPPPTTPTFTAVQDTVFTPSCALAAFGCHAGPVPPVGMDLSEGVAYSFIVNVPSGELPGLVRVAPGNAANSYLYMKITGDPRIAGSRMPLIGGPLDSDRIELVRAWINDGAPNN